MSARTRAKRYERMSQEKLDSLIEKKSDVVIVEREHVKPQPILHRDEEYDTFHPEETLRTFISQIMKMLVKYESNKEELSRLENEMQDLLHFMEMTKNKNANEGFKLYKKLCDVRRKRRACKNEIDLLQPVYDAFSETKLLDQLASIQGRCKYLKQSIDNRGYHIRTDILSEFIE